MDELKISEQDQMVVEVAKSKLLAARSQHETADIAFKHLVLQLFMKYGLKPEDQIKEDGTIVKANVVKEDEKH